MKEVKAIIQPFMLTKVVEALKQIDGLPGLTVDRDVRGFGQTRGEASRHKIIDDLVEYVPKAKRIGGDGRPDDSGQRPYR